MVAGRPPLPPNPVGNSSASESAQQHTALARLVLLGRVWRKAPGHSVTVTHGVRGPEPTKEISNVTDAICGFAGNVAAGIFRVPRCRRVDSHSVNHRGDFFDHAP